MIEDEPSTSITILLPTEWDNIIVKPVEGMSYHNVETQDVPAVDEIPQDFKAAIDGAPVTDEPIIEVPIRRSIRERRSANPNDYYIFER